jgi:hypothetical protein
MDRSYTNMHKSMWKELYLQFIPDFRHFMADETFEEVVKK